MEGHLEELEEVELESYIWGTYLERLEKQLNEPEKHLKEEELENDVWETHLNYVNEPERI